MHKCEHNEKDTTDPWKNLSETQPPSLIINGDKVSLRHWPSATEQLFIFHLSWWPRSLLLCFSSPPELINTGFVRSSLVCGEEESTVKWEKWAERRANIFFRQRCVPVVQHRESRLYPFTTCFLKVKVIIDIGGPLSETMREEELLGIKLRLKIVKSEYAISYIADYNKITFI